MPNVTRPKLLGLLDKQVEELCGLSVVGHVGCIMMRVKCYIENLLRDDAIDMDGTIKHRRDKVALIRVRILF